MEQQENPTPAGPTAASAWQSQVNIDGQDLPLPSGNVCRARNISPQAFLSSGIIPNPLMAIIRKAINEAQGLPPKELEKMMGDDKMLVAALQLFDRMLVYVIIEPVVKMPPPCRQCGGYANTNEHSMDNPDAHRYNEGDRDPNVLYADVVDMEDKVFIAQWCLGGTSDLELFRQQSADGVADLLGREDVPSPAQ